MPNPKTIYLRLSSLFPEGMVRATERLMAQGGFERISARVYLGFALFFSTSLAALFFFITSLLTTSVFLQVAVPLFALCTVAAVFYFILALQVSARAKQIEVVLPSALQMMSSNIRAGMTIENALWNSARPEFGELGKEIKRVSADVFGGVRVAKALDNMARRVCSPTLERSVKLINEGIALGGQMAPLLDSVAADTRTQQLLRKEISTSTLSYALFIAFAAIIAAPLLFSVTTYYSQINEQVTAKQTHVELDKAVVEKSGLSGLLGLGGGAKGLSSEDIKWFSMVALSVTAVFAALILGLIHEGSVLAGVLWVPVFWVVSLGIYLLSLGALNAALGVLVH